MMTMLMGIVFIKLHLDLLVHNVHVVAVYFSQHSALSIPTQTINKHTKHDKAAITNINNSE